jgi:hypothetical protein
MLAKIGITLDTMTTTATSAGQKLCADMARAGARPAAGRPLGYDERQTHAITAAAAAADRDERLQALWDAELAGETRATVAVKLAAEIRLCEKHVTDLLARVIRARDRRSQSGTSALPKHVGNSTLRRPATDGPRRSAP